MENLITFVKVGEERLNADYIPFPCKKGDFIFFVEEVDKEDGPRAWGGRDRKLLLKMRLSRRPKN